MLYINDYELDMKFNNEKYREGNKTANINVQNYTLTATVQHAEHDTSNM